ncbi:MAG: hypothetical protein VX278_01060, partial [Myxococcota bacterium]|nr:hypothetical protein [Myxococcota bacterium]
MNYALFWIFSYSLAHGAVPLLEIKAEQRRIRSEMTQALQAERWTVLLKQYESISRLRHKKAPLVFEDHILGATAASELGDVTK